jgi:hypothetical protein
VERCEDDMELEYPDYVTALRSESPDLAAEVASFRGLEQVLQWMRQRGLMQTAVDMIGMDEFSYDFLIQLEPAGRWIAFGVT